MKTFMKRDCRMVVTVHYSYHSSIVEKKKKKNYLGYLTEQSLSCNNTEGTTLFS